MKDDGCGFIPIADAGRLVGVVTDRDIVIRCLPIYPSGVYSEEGKESE